MQNFKMFIFLIFFIIHPICAEAQVINKVIAVVNDEVITQQDVDQLLAVLYAQYVHAYKGDELLEKMEEAKKDILEKMIEDNLILSRAKELDIVVTEEELNDGMEYVKEGFPSEEEFHKTLEAQGITVANLKDRYRDQIMLKKLVDFEVKSKVTVQPSEVTAYYEGHKSEFKRDEKYKVRHISIKAEDEVGFDLARVEMQRVHAKLENGRDFSELAKKYSQGPRAEEGGDMGYIGRGEMLKELDETIFSLKPGEFSEPVKSHLGYHIFKIEDVRPSEYLSLEDVQRDLKKILFQNKFKEKLDKWVAELRSKAYISIK